uniref:DUF6894 family protein n=1 Tax=uncultured Sphingomonas sp. TaxID=158754 RepID=UPI0035CC71E4
MSSIRDRAYYRRRELEERDRALKADASIAFIHVELADHYAECARGEHQSGSAPRPERILVTTRVQVEIAAAGFDDARTLAVAAAQSMIVSEGRQGRWTLGWAIDITDDDGALLATLEFSDADVMAGSS